MFLFWLKFIVKKNVKKMLKEKKKLGVVFNYEM